MSLKLLNRLVLALAVCWVMSSAARAASISVNYAVGNNGSAGASVAGPAGLTGSSNWNNYGVTGPVGAFTGAATDAVDDSGAATTADVTWNSHQTWTNGAAGSENENLLQGYLDDNGAAGVHIEVTEIPYAIYNLHVYFNNDFGDGTVGLFDIDVNGNTYASTGAFSQSHGGVIDSGNSLTVTGLTGSTLNIDGAQRTNPGISNVTGFEIVEIPEPTSLVLLGVGSLLTGLGLRRRK